MMQEDYDSQSGSPGPSKRRRYSRVSRACNECRVRKIRCNGRQPCEPCEDFERHCTFTSTKGQRVAGAPRTKILEDRLRRARSLIAKLQAQHPSAHLNTEVNSIFDSPPGSPSSVSDTTGVTDESSGDNLESMMDGKGRLLSNNKSAAYYGGGSGFAFLQETQEFLPQGSDGRNRTEAWEVPNNAIISNLFDSPLADKQALDMNVSFSGLLPSKRTARALLAVVFGQAYPLLQFLHEPTFQKQTDRIYDIDPMDYQDLDHDFLPLFYSVTALGYVFNRKMHQKYGCSGALDQALRHFVAARRMLNLNRCRDILGLQTLICLALFLITTARLATAHTIIGLAVSTAIKMGLHSRTSCTGLTPLSQEIKRRVFWTVVKLDTYSSVILGLPAMIDIAYVDQVKPSGLSRDYSNQDRDGIGCTTRRTLAASAQHLELLMIIGRMIKKLYPKTDREAEKGGALKKLTVSRATIAEIEEDFKIWREGLADALGSPEGQDTSGSIVYDLEMVHHFGHILLYRPFLYCLAKTRGENLPDPRILQCATSCVRISRTTITRSEEMLRQGFLSPAAWHSIYTIFLSLVTLVFFLATQHSNQEYAAIQKEAECGVRILHRTSCLDTGSRRCLDALRVLTKRLSQIIDLDIDRLAEGVDCICQTQSRSPQETKKSQQKQPQQQHDAQPKPPRREASESSETPPVQTGNSRPLTYRHQPGPAPTLPVMVNPAGVPIYHPQGVPYYSQIPMWDQPMDMLHTPHNLYFAPTTFPSDGPPSQPYGKEYGQPEMKIPHTEEFAWSFPMGAETGGEPSAGGRRLETQNTATLTPEDIAAFMSINPGPEPFV